MEIWPFWKRALTPGMGPGPGGDRKDLRTSNYTHPGAGTTCKREAGGKARVFGRSPKGQCLVGSLTSSLLQGSPPPRHHLLQKPSQGARRGRARDCGEGAGMCPSCPEPASAEPCDTRHPASRPGAWPRSCGRLAVEIDAATHRMAGALSAGRRGHRQGLGTPADPSRGLRQGPGGQSAGRGTC